MARVGVGLIGVQGSLAATAVLGSRAIGPEVARRVVAAWLGAEFEENPRRREKMAKLRAIEERFLR